MNSTVLHLYGTKLPLKYWLLAIYTDGLEFSKIKGGQAERYSCGIAGIKENC